MNELKEPHMIIEVGQCKGGRGKKPTIDVTFYSVHIHIVLSALIHDDKVFIEQLLNIVRGLF